MNLNNDHPYGTTTTNNKHTDEMDDSNSRNNNDYLTMNCPLGGDQNSSNNNSVDLSLSPPSTSSQSSLFNPCSMYSSNYNHNFYLFQNNNNTSSDDENNNNINNSDHMDMDDHSMNQHNGHSSSSSHGGSTATTTSLGQLFQMYMNPYGRVIDTSELFRQLSNNKFTIVVFYRGNWCDFCGKNLIEYNAIHQNVKHIGGSLIGVCAQSEELVKKEIREWKLEFDICSDTTNMAATLYHMNITMKDTETYGRLVTLFKKCNPESTNGFQLESSNEYSQGICQPGVLIVKQDGSTCFKWTGSVLERNAYGAFERIQPTYVLKIANFMFNEWSQKDSLFAIKQNREDEVFNYILSNEQARKIFRTHLQLEYNEELLQFLDIVETGRHSFEDLSGFVRFVYNEFVKPDSKRELACLSSNSHLLSRFEAFCSVTQSTPQQQQQRIQSSFNEMARLSFLEESQQTVRKYLSAGPFLRFLSTPDAMPIIKQLADLFE